MTPATAASSEQTQAQSEAPASSEGKKLPLLQRIVRAAGSSVLATGASQGTFIGVMALQASATTASSVGFAAGAVVNWVFARNWVWGRKGKPGLKRELVPYLAVIALTGLCSVGLTTVAGMITEPLKISGFLRILILDGAFLGSYALVFILKFTLLDRFVFAGGRLAERTPEATSQS